MKISKPSVPVDINYNIVNDKKILEKVQLEGMMVLRKHASDITKRKFW